MKRRILNLAIALDQFLYVLVTLGNGSPDETLSAAAWRWESMGKWQGLLRPVIDTLFFFDRNHCWNSFEAERLRKHLPPEYAPADGR